MGRNEIKGAVIQYRNRREPLSFAAGSIFLLFCIGWYGSTPKKTILRPLRASNDYSEQCYNRRGGKI